MAIGGGAVLLVALGIWALNRESGSSSGKLPAAGRQPATEDAVADKEPAAQVPAVKAEGHPGKTPDFPAPEIQEADLAKAEALYAEARNLDIQARKAQKSGDHSTFNRLINDAWDRLEQIGPLIQRYEDWFEEADLSGWAMPGSYVGYRRRMEKIDKLRGRIRRIRPMRRN